MMIIIMNKRESNWAIKKQELRNNFQVEALVILLYTNNCRQFRE